MQRATVGCIYRLAKPVVASKSRSGSDADTLSGQEAAELGPLLVRASGIAGELTNGTTPGAEEVEETAAAARRLFAAQ